MRSARAVPTRGDAKSTESIELVFLLLVLLFLLIWLSSLCREEDLVEG